MKKELKDLMILPRAVRVASEKYKLIYENLLAVLITESNADVGFYRTPKPVVSQKFYGWLPLIRIEGHHVYKHLKNRPDLLTAASKIGAASRKMNAIKQGSQSKRWEMFEKLYRIDPEAAVLSTSFGLGQVLGANFKMLGFNTPEEFFLFVKSGICEQVDVTVRYIDKAGLSGYLNNQKWKPFARGYNGPAYAKYQYDKKIQQAMRLVRSGSALPAMWDDYINFGDEGPVVVIIQKRLAAMDYYKGPIDGDFGPGTRAAVKEYQSGLLGHEEPSGVIKEDELDDLLDIYIEDKPAFDPTPSAEPIPSNPVGVPELDSSTIATIIVQVWDGILWPVLRRLMGKKG